MNQMWMINGDAYSLIYDLAVKHGKKPGDSMEAEFKEILKKHPEMFTLLGKTDKDADQVTGELREAGIKVINPKEIERRKDSGI